MTGLSQIAGVSFEPSLIASFSGFIEFYRLKALNFLRIREKHVGTEYGC